MAVDLRTLLKDRQNAIWAGQDTIPPDYAVKVLREDFLRGRCDLDRLIKAIEIAAESKLIKNIFSLEKRYEDQELAADWTDTTLDHHPSTANCNWCDERREAYERINNVDTTTGEST